MSRHRKRRMLKWIGLGGCVTLVLVIAASQRWRVRWSTGDHNWTVQGGGIMYLCSEGSFRMSQGLAWRKRGGPMMKSWWWFHYVDRTSSRVTAMIIPLWAPLIGIALPTFWLWRRDRRILPGHCLGCGYDLTGLIEPRCPECGTAFPPNDARQGAADDG